MIPSNVITAVNNLSATQSVLGPFLQASVAARLAFEQQIFGLTTLIDTAIDDAAGKLDDGFSGDTYPQVTAQSLLGLAQSASDQYALSKARGEFGRMLLNVQITYRGGPLPISYVASQTIADFSDPENTALILGLM